MPNAGRTGKANRARPEGHGGSAYHIRFIFALGSATGSRVALSGLVARQPDGRWQIGDGACHRRTARFACRVAAI
jgi:hypothetical protein